MKPGKPEQQTYQVWHREGERFTKVAEVKAAELQSAFFLTLGMKEIRWPDHRNVTAFVENPRSTTFGDVIIDHNGVAYCLHWYGRHELGFKETGVPVEAVKQEPKDYEQFLKEATDRAMFRMDGRSQEPER
jgi:hypothetical protein